MHIRHFFPAVLALSVIGLSVLPGQARAEEPTATPTATMTQIPPRFFNARLQTKALDTPVGPLQDVQGKVIAKTGAGIDGLLVRAFSADWQAFDTTRDGGKFKFSLTPGSYTIQLVDMVAEELKLVADGKSEPQVEFYEVESLPASLASMVASPSATASPTASPTSTATSSPTSAPLPLPTTDTGAPTAKLAPSPTVTSLLFLTDIDPKPWLNAFVYGVALGGAFVFLGLAVSWVRRL